MTSLSDNEKKSVDSKSTLNATARRTKNRISAVIERFMLCSICSYEKEVRVRSNDSVGRDSLFLCDIMLPRDGIYAFQTGSNPLHYLVP